MNTIDNTTIHNLKNISNYNENQKRNNNNNDMLDCTDYTSNKLIYPPKDADEYFD